MTKCLWYSVEDPSSDPQSVLSVIPVSAQWADTEGFPEPRGYLVIYLGSRRDLIEANKQDREQMRNVDGGPRLCGDQGSLVIHT